MVATHPPCCCLTRSACPAQFGHSMRSPDLVPGGSEIIAPQSGHRTSSMSFDTQEPLETATIKSDDNLIVHHDYRNSHSPGPRDQLAPGRFILSHVLRRKRNP